VPYLVDKLDRGFDRAIYVLGADHHGTSKCTRPSHGCSATTRRASRCCSTSSCIWWRGGEQTKMSKRRGDVVFLDDFIDDVGVDAARWFLVNRGPDQTIEIDLDLAAEKSAKNPVFYVQYAHARIAAISAQTPKAQRSEGRRPGRSPPRRRS